MTHTLPNKRRQQIVALGTLRVVRTACTLHEKDLFTPIPQLSFVFQQSYYKFWGIDGFKYVWKLKLWATSKLQQAKIVFPHCSNRSSSDPIRNEGVSKCCCISQLVLRCSWSCISSLQKLNQHCWDNLWKIPSSIKMASSKSLCLLLMNTDAVIVKELHQWRRITLIPSVIPGTVCATEAKLSYCGHFSNTSYCCSSMVTLSSWVESALHDSALGHRLFCNTG